ncbi:MAG: GAF domain-containing protein [Chloroflexota bacterium]
MADKPGTSRWDALKGVFSGRASLGSNPSDAPPQPAEAPPAAVPRPAAPDRSAPIPEDAAIAGLMGVRQKPRDDQARLAALYRVSRTLGTSLDLDEVLAQVIDAVIELTGAERGLLVLVEGESGEWQLRMARNIDADKLNTWEKEISSTIINTALEIRKGVVTADAQSDPRFSTAHSVVFNVLRSMMVAPMLARGKIIGAIYVDSRILKGIFDADDLEMMDTFATQAAFAIDNARIYTRTVMQVQQLTIELDEVRRDKQVAEITETEYFRKLQSRVQSMKATRKKGSRSE